MNEENREVDFKENKQNFKNNKNYESTFSFKKKLKNFLFRRICQKLNFT